MIDLNVCVWLQIYAGKTLSVSPERTFFLRDMKSPNSINIWDKSALKSSNRF
jgi:hypothetical protein